MSPITRRFALLAAAILVCASAPLRLSAQEGRPAWEWGFRGTLLMNGFYNEGRTNNLDVPTIAGPTTPGRGHLAGGSIRQTRLVGTGDLAGFAGGALHGELDVDFYGGQLGNGHTSPLLRLRRAFAEVQWDRGALLVGQEAPLVAEINPMSLATVGIPGFASAGNLWLWIPQIRGSWNLSGGSGVRIDLAGAVMAPNSEDAAGAFLTTPSIAETSGRPMYEARVRTRWGERGELGIGGHVGWLALSSAPGVEADAVVVSGIIPLGTKLDLRGEWFSGKGLGGLGGGGIGQSINGGGEALETSGGWAQLNLLLGTTWELGAGYGLDDPKGTTADEGNPPFRTKNQQLSGRLQWRLAPAVIALEYRRITTEYGGGVGELKASQVNLGMGVEF